MATFSVKHKIHFVLHPCYSIISKLQISKKFSWKNVLAWVSLMLSIMSGAGIGPMFKYMRNHNIPPFLSASWRCQSMATFLIPLAILEYKFTSRKQPSYHWFKNDSIEPKYPLFILIVIAGFSWAGSLLFWIYGLQFTTTVRASLLVSLHPIVVASYLRCSGVNINYLEYVGVMISLLGIAFSEIFNEFHISELSTSTGLNKHPYLQLLGDSCCVLSAIFHAVVMINRQHIKDRIPLMQYTAITTVIVTILATVSSIWLETPTFNIGVLCCEDHCVFGWLADKWLIKILFFGLLIGVICIAGFNYSMQHISPLVFSVSQLLDPIITGIISWASQLEGIPSLSTWVGGSVLLIGIGFITVGERKRKAQSTINKDLHDTRKEDTSYRNSNNDPEPKTTGCSESFSNKDIVVNGGTGESNRNTDRGKILYVAPSFNIHPMLTSNILAQIIPFSRDQKLMSNKYTHYKVLQQKDEDIELFPVKGNKESDNVST